MGVILKTCFKCSATKPIDDYYKHPKMADGHLGKCKECTKRDVSDNYRRTIVDRKAYDVERNKMPERKDCVRRTIAKQKQEHPEKYMARTAVRNAIRCGRLTPLPCESCGSLFVQAHHDDYARPLDVRWLCFVHHREHHGQVASETDSVPQHSVKVAS